MNSIEAGKWLFNASSSYMMPRHQKKYLQLLRERNTSKRKISSGRKNDRNDKATAEHGSERGAVGGTNGEKGEDKHVNTSSLVITEESEREEKGDNENSAEQVADCWQDEENDDVDRYDTTVPILEDLESDVALPRLGGGYCHVGDTDDDSDHDDEDDYNDNHDNHSNHKSSSSSSNNTYSNNSHGNNTNNGGKNLINNHINNSNSNSNNSSNSNNNINNTNTKKRSNSLTDNKRKKKPTVTKSKHPLKGSIARNPPLKKGPPPKVAKIPGADADAGDNCYYAVGYSYRYRLSP